VDVEQEAPKLRESLAGADRLHDVDASGRQACFIRGAVAIDGIRGRRTVELEQREPLRPRALAMFARIREHAFLPPLTGAAEDTGPHSRERLPERREGGQRLVGLAQPTPPARLLRRSIRATLLRNGELTGEGCPTVTEAAVDSFLRRPECR